MLHYGFGFPRGGFLTFLGVDRLEYLCHQLYIGAKRYREHIAVKVNGTALVLGFREYFSHSFQHTKALVSNNEFHPIQATAAEPLEEADPTGLVLFHTLGGAKNLAVSILIDCYGYIFKLSAPVAAQVDPILDPIHIDIRFLVQLADGGRRHLAAPQSLGNILRTSDRYTCQAHLNESFFCTALPVAIPLNDGSLKGDPP